MDIKILGNLLQETIDRGNLRVFLGIHCKKVDPHREEPGMRILQGTES